MASSIVEEEEVTAEVEAVQAVYGDDCVVSLSTIFYICLVAQKTMESKTKT